MYLASDFVQFSAAECVCHSAGHSLHHCAVAELTRRSLASNFATCPDSRRSASAPSDKALSLGALANDGLLLSRTTRPRKSSYGSTIFSLVLVSASPSPPLCSVTTKKDFPCQSQAYRPSHHTIFMDGLGSRNCSSRSFQGQPCGRLYQVPSRRTFERLGPSHAYGFVSPSARRSLRATLFHSLPCLFSLLDHGKSLIPWLISGHYLFLLAHVPFSHFVSTSDAYAVEEECWLMVACGSGILI